MVRIVEETAVAVGGVPAVAAVVVVVDPEAADVVATEAMAAPGTRRNQI